jgi:hypothetical protein
MLIEITSDTRQESRGEGSAVCREMHGALSGCRALGDPTRDGPSSSFLKVVWAGGSLNGGAS